MWRTWCTACCWPLHTDLKDFPDNNIMPVPYMDIPDPSLQQSRNVCAVYCSFVECFFFLNTVWVVWWYRHIQLYIKRRYYAVSLLTTILRLSFFHNTQHSFLAKGRICPYMVPALYLFVPEINHVDIWRRYTYTPSHIYSLYICIVASQLNADYFST